MSLAAKFYFIFFQKINVEKNCFYPITFGRSIVFGQYRVLTDEFVHFSAGFGDPRGERGGSKNVYLT